MANVVYGDSDIFAHMTYGEPAPELYSYVEREYERARSNFVGSALALANQSYQMYQDVKNSDAVRAARAAMRRVGSLWQHDSIRYLSTYGETQNAPPTMLRWLMAEPTIRRHYHEGRCDGYSGRYVDIEPGRVGEHHTDYQKVDNGYVHVQDDGSWHATTYSNSWEEHPVELTLSEQDDIRSTWDVIRSAEFYGTDATDRYDGSL